MIATPFVWIAPPSCASCSTSTMPSRPSATTAVMRIGCPNSTSPAEYTDRPLTTPTRKPCGVERDLAAERELADVTLGSAGAFATFAPRDLDVLGGDDAACAALARRGTDAAPADAGPASAQSLSPAARAAASALANAAVSSSGERADADLLPIARETRREVEQARARARDRTCPTRASRPSPSGRRRAR